MARTRPESSVRTYHHADRDAFLDLYERVWGRERSAAWFDWRFEANPFGDGVQMVVAERDGQLIGAEPLLPFRLRVDGEDHRAYQPADWIVDPAYQQQGVFTRMTERTLDAYDDAALAFNFPTDALLPGLAKFDWRVVGTRPMAYRIPRPSAALSVDEPFASAANAVFRVGDTVGQSLHRLLARLAGRADVRVEREPGVPTVVSDLYADAPPDAFHVPRTDAFREWRFANPRWTTATYVASRAGAPVAAVVAALEPQADGRRVLRVLDVQPATARPNRKAALAAIYDELVSDARDVDVVRTPAAPLPGALRRGFVRDDAVGVSLASNATTHVVRPLPANGDRDWRLAGRSLTDPANWVLSLADQDVA